MDNEQPKNEAPCKRCGQEPYPEATRECIKRGTGECELAMREGQTVSRVETGKPVPRDRAWHMYPVGTKAPAHGGGYWVRVTGGWKWCTGDVFPNPGGDNMDMVILPTPPAPQRVVIHMPRAMGKSVPAAVEGFKGELNAHLAAITDEQLRTELEAAGCKFTQPAVRPTPITDGIQRGQNVLEICADLECKLAEARESLEARRELNALQRGEIDKLRDNLAKSDHEIERLRAAVEESNIAELNRRLAEYQRCVDLCHDAVGESRGSDITELHKYFEGYRNTIKRLNELEDQLAERTAECEEQARLLGMSSERESRLIAERDALVEALEGILAADEEAEAEFRKMGIPPEEEEHPSTVSARAALAAVKGGQGE